MRIAHLADTHLGFRQYGLYEREEDFYAVFEDIVDRIVEERPDCVIHSGDLFERSQPPTKALKVVQQALGRLNEAGIPVYALPGNHDVVIRRNALPPHVLYDYLDLRIIGGKNPWYVQGDVFIGGIPFRSRFYHSTLVEDLAMLAAEAEKCRKRVLVLHQAIETFLPFDYELNLSEIPEIFDYYAMGHIHRRIVERYGRGILAYPGSTELCEKEELSSYRKEGKGFYLVDLEGDTPELMKVDVPLRREMIDEEISAGNLEDSLKALRERVAALKERPILNIRISGVKGDASPIYEMLESAIGHMVLQLRPHLVNEEEKQPERLEESSLEIHAVISRLCGDDSELRELALTLYDLLGTGNKEELEAAKALAEDALERIR